MRDSVIFYRSFYDAIKELPSDTQSELYSAIFEYSLNFEEVELSRLAKTIFTLIKPQLEANNRRFENGKKGGKPKQSETKTKPKPNQIETKTEANNNVNDNNNVNANDNVNDIKEKKIVFGENKKVEFTESEYQKLLLKLGSDTMEKCIHKLDHYKNQSGKKYKSDYSAMHSWVIEKIEKEKSSAKNDKSPLEQHMERMHRDKDETIKVIPFG